jgi:hypothetical protein
MAAQSLHRFAVCEIDQHKQPTRVHTLVEGKDWEKATRLAFSAARHRVHEDRDIATGVFQIHPTRVERIATAGYSRLALATEAPSFEASLALVAS